MKFYFVVTTADGFPAHVLGEDVVEEFIAAQDDQNAQQVLSGTKIMEFTQRQWVTCHDEAVVVCVDVGWQLRIMSEDDLKVLIPGISEGCEDILCAPVQVVE